MPLKQAHITPVDPRIPAVHDSGERRAFATGSQRDTQQGKGRYDLIPTLLLRRLARHYEAGAVKYDARNWEKGQPLSVYFNSAMRHLLKAMDGYTDEDHEAAAIWNITGFMWTRAMIERGVLPRELDDRPLYDDFEQGARVLVSEVFPEEQGK